MTRAELEQDIALAKARLEDTWARFEHHSLQATYNRDLAEEALNMYRKEADALAALHAKRDGRAPFEFDPEPAEHGASGVKP